MDNRERARASYKTKETNFVGRKTWKFKAAVRKLEMLSASMREVLARPWVGVCVPLALSLYIVNAIEFNSIYLSSITVFHDISKQLQQGARIYVLFLRWHLAIAITSLYKMGLQMSHFSPSERSHCSPALFSSFICTCTTLAIN